MDRQVRPISALLLLAALTACGSGEVSVPEDSSSPVDTTPQPQTAPQPDAADFNPALPADPLQSKVALINASAESDTSVANAEIEIEAWQTFGGCSISEDTTLAGYGDKSFRLGYGCELQQLTQATLETGDAASVLFEASVSEAEQVTVELLGIDGNGRVTTIAESVVPLSNDPDGNSANSDDPSGTTQQWHTYQALLPHGVADDASGNRVGIRIKHSDEQSATPVYVDGVSVNLFQPADDNTTRFNDAWDQTCDQLWTGEHYWANTLSDWHVTTGRVQARNVSNNKPLRTLHRIASVVSEAPADFSLQVDTGFLEITDGDAFHGLLIGAGARLDYRAASMIHSRSGQNGGLVVGVDAGGRAFIKDNARDLANLDISGNGSIDANGVTLNLDATYQQTGDYQLSLTVTSVSGTVLSTANAMVPAARVLGNIALIANAGSSNTIHWFNNFSGSGGKLREVPQREFGPILFSTYTVSDDVLTMNAQLPPVCANHLSAPELQIAQNGQWQTIAQAQVDPQSYTAKFQIDWDASQRAHYRIATRISQNTNDSESSRDAYYRGTIQADPTDSDELIIGVFNGRESFAANDTEGSVYQTNSGAFSWTHERLLLPHNTLLTNAANHHSHLLAFVGDQIDAWDPASTVETTDANALIEDYLWKWYQFGWSVRDMTRNTPAIVLPDNQDMYQENLWGESGRMAAIDSDGGYVMPAELIQVVQNTQAGSLPPAYDPTPVEQGIGVYYTDMIVGGVGIAVLEDRKFKTSVSNSANPALLGQRQLSFLDDWARDWRGQTMKLVLSQTPLAEAFTHTNNLASGTPLYNTNGAPVEQRNAAVAALRRAAAPHINGDTQLGISLQHGINTDSDAVHSFSAPPMTNNVIRAWDPETDVPDSSLNHRGAWIDNYGNLINVLAAANPQSYLEPAVAKSTTDGTGYGIVRVNKSTRQYTFEAWPALTDTTSANSVPHAEWPVTVDQADNDGRVIVDTLPVRIAAVDNPVVTVVNEQTGQLVYARRFNTAEVSAPIYDGGASYTLTLSDPESSYEETFTGQLASTVTAVSGL